MPSPVVGKVIDANTGAPIYGAACFDTINTQCCNCWPSGCSGCNGCTSGSGYKTTVNTDTSGSYSIPMEFSCPCSHTMLVTANGYNSTSIDFGTGPNDGTITGPTVQMVATNYVPQSNQGPAGTAQYATQNASSDAGTTAAKATSPVTNPSTKEDIAIAIVGILAVVGIIAYLKFVR